MIITRTLLGALALVTVVTLTAGTALAKPWKNNKGKSHHSHSHVHQNQQGNWDNGNVDFDDVYRPNYRRSTIADVLAAVLSGQSRYDISANSLRQQRALPPGIAKNLRRGKPLPPGIAKKMYNLPPNAYDDFGINPNYRAGVYGNNVVIATAAGVIVDVLRDIF